MARVAAALSLTSESGPIELVLDEQTGAVDVETRIGDITLTASPRLNADVSLSTSGEITTDFSISIDRQPHEEPSKHGRITVGEGQVSIRLETRRGAISVLRAAAD